MKRKILKAAVYSLLALSIGSFIAIQINTFLGIKCKSKPLPLLVEYPSPQAEKCLDPLREMAGISLPREARKDDLYNHAVVELTRAVQFRTGATPRVFEYPSRPKAGRLIVIGSTDKNPFSIQKSPPLNSEEAFHITASSQGAYDVLSIIGASRTGDVYGIYWLAERLYCGISEDELMSLDQTISPMFGHRFVETGAVGIPFVPERWGDDYSLHNHAFEDVILKNTPYIDESAFRRVEEEFRDYVHRMISYGNNGIVIHGFLEYVNFDRVGNGLEIYGSESPYRKRHSVLRDKFGRLFQYAHDMGMSVILKTDMVALTSPLQNYIERKFGGFDVSRRDVWEVYRLGLEELFEAFPYLDGLMVRIGEAGAVYNLEGWDYFSALHVKSEESVKIMLRELLDVAEKYDRLIVFRSWSVGVGEIGDMHTNPRTYERVLNGLQSPHLIVSTKYVMGDFYSYLPFNPTLLEGDQKRLIEFQARREYEAFCAFPNYLGPLHKNSLKYFLKHNPRIVGIWLWTQDGGPQRAGPLSLYPFHGFWLFIDANAYVTSRLAWDNEANLRDITEGWIRRNITSEPVAVRNLTEMMFLSREAVLKGLYIGEFSKKQVLALGLEPPPMLWIFEWDILSGSSSILSIVYSICRENLGVAIDEGFEAVEVVRRMKRLAMTWKASDSDQHLLHEKLIESLDYEENLLKILALYRKSFLCYYHWLATGERVAHGRWKEAYGQFQKEKHQHRISYQENLDFPAYNFFAADAGMGHAERGRTMSWLARILLLLTSFFPLLGSKSVQRLLPSFPGKEGIHLYSTAFVCPWKQENIETNTANIFVIYLFPAALMILGILTFSSFLSLSFVGLILTSLVIFIAVFFLLLRRNFSLIAAVLVPFLYINFLFMAVVGIRGPLFFWFLFWTSSTFRIIFISLTTAALAWIFFVVYACSRTVPSMSPTKAAGNILIAIGSVFVIHGLFSSLISLESCLTGLNNELAFLPLGLSKILGITTHLNIPQNVPFFLAGFGAVLLIGGGIMRTIRFRQKTWPKLR